MLDVKTESGCEEQLKPQSVRDLPTFQFSRGLGGDFSYIVGYNTLIISNICTFKGLDLQPRQTILGDYSKLLITCDGFLIF